MTAILNVSRYGARTAHVRSNATSAMNANPNAAHVRPRRALIRPEGWTPFYEARAAGLVPRGGFVRIALDDGLTIALAMIVPHEVNPWDLDFSPVAGLDAFLIFNGDTTSYGRLTSCVGAVLRFEPACLHLLDAPPGIAPRWARVKVGYEQDRRGYLREHAQ